MFGDIEGKLTVGQAVVTKLSPKFRRTFLSGLVLLIAGLVGNVVNQAVIATRMGLGTHRMQTLPVFASDQYARASTALPNLVVNQYVQLVCEGATVLGLVVLVAATAYHFGQTRHRRRA